MSLTLYIRKANPPAQPPAQPETPPAGEEAKTSKPKKGSKYNVPVMYLDKKRYPKKPSNSLGETKATWVMAQGTKPIFGGGEKEEPESSKPGEPSTVEGKASSSVTEEDTTTVKPAATTATTVPEAAKVSLLSPGKAEDTPASSSGAAPSATPDKAETPAPKKKQDPFSKEAVTKLHAKLREKAAEIRARESKADEKKTEIDLQSLDPKVVAAAQRKKEAAKAEETRRSSKPATPEAVASHQMHTAKAKEAVDQAWELLDDPSLSEEEKTHIAAVNDAIMEHAKQSHAPNADERKALAGMQKYIKDLHTSKVKASKKEADKAEKLNAKAAKEAEAAKDPLKVKPSSPDELAVHQKHVSKAKEAVDQAWELLDSKDLSAEEKSKVAEINDALLEHAQQEHVPSAQEKKALSDMQSYIKDLHSNKVKPAKKEEAKAAKDQKKLVVKQEKQKVKEEDKAVKEQQKLLVQEAKDEAGTDVEAHHTPAREASLMGAMHSGRAVGTAASSAASSASGSGLGKQALTLTAEGAASAGHSLLSDKKDNVTYSETNKEPDLSEAEKFGQEYARKKGGAKSTEFNKSLSAPSEACDMLKSLTARVTEKCLPVSTSKLEFLTQECGYTREDVVKGVASIKGHLEPMYYKWLAERACNIARGLV